VNPDEPNIQSTTSFRNFRAPHRPLLQILPTSIFNLIQTICESYLESLTEFIAHDVVDQGIYARGNVIQNARDVSCEHEDVSDIRIVHVFHGPHVGEPLSVEWSPA
jgi:hypothetical protein